MRKIIIFGFVVLFIVSMMPDLGQAIQVTGEEGTYILKSGPGPRPPQPPSPVPPRPRPEPTPSPKPPRPRNP